MRCPRVGCGVPIDGFVACPRCGASNPSRDDPLAALPVILVIVVAVIALAVLVLPTVIR